MSKEIWKDILGYEGLYQISNLGRVKSLRRSHYYSKGIGGIRTNKERILGGSIGGRGVLYKRVNLRKDEINRILHVHRLVLMHFDRMPKIGEECNHIDFNPLNNRIDNLEWLTHSKNQLHSGARLSKAKTGENHPRAIVTNEEAIDIKRMRKQGIKYKEIAEKYGLLPNTCFCIVSRNYSHINHLV